MASADETARQLQAQIEEKEKEIEVERVRACTQPCLMKTLPPPQC